MIPIWYGRNVHDFIEYQWPAMLLWLNIYLLYIFFSNQFLHAFSGYCKTENQSKIHHTSLTSSQMTDLFSSYWTSVHFAFFDVASMIWKFYFTRFVVFSICRNYLDKSWNQPFWEVKVRRENCVPNSFSGSGVWKHFQKAHTKVALLWFRLASWLPSFALSHSATFISLMDHPNVQDSLVELYYG